MKMLELRLDIFDIFRSGGNIEVMGLLLGKVDANVMVVMDCFALPVEGTETRVNVQSEGFEYMTAYVESAKRVGRLEHVLGWYHSHPGYGCWLSGKFQFFSRSYKRVTKITPES